MLLAPGKRATLQQPITEKVEAGSDGLLCRESKMAAVYRAVRTDELERPGLEALGDDLDELREYLDAWSEAIIAGGSHPERIAGVYNVGGGPRFGPGLTIDTAAGLQGQPGRG